MALKTSKCCCCPQCTSRTADCCTCVPRHICVRVYTSSPRCFCEDTTARASWDEDSRQYAITICGIDLRFYFDTVDGVCSLCMDSTCASVSHQCIPVDCSNLRDLDVTFSLDASDCGDDECDDMSVQVTVDDWLDVTFCDGCRCAPKCICFYAEIYEPEFQPGPLCSHSEVVCYEDPVVDEVCWLWDTVWPDECVFSGDRDIDVSLCLQTGALNSCQLQLTGTVNGQNVVTAEACDGGLYETPAEPHMPVTTQNQDCPDGFLYETCFKVNDGARYVYLRATYARCGSCPAPCCCEITNDVLYATITNAVGCGPPTSQCCDCADGTVIPLLKTSQCTGPNISEWSGTGPFCNIFMTLTLTCETGTNNILLWTLSYSYSTLGATFEVSPDEGSCDPFEVCFRFIEASARDCNLPPLSPADPPSRIDICITQ